MGYALITYMVTSNIILIAQVPYNTVLFENVWKYLK